VVVDPAGVLTYAELDVRADELAAGLVARGVGPGDVVASALPSGGDWLVLAVALDRVGAVLAAGSTAITAAERHDQVELVRPVLVVAGPDTVDGMPLRAAPVTDWPKVIIGCGDRRATEAAATAGGHEP
jgi:non-ribosomal peptide synthetase component E (peptide arylation enzyme)